MLNVDDTALVIVDVQGKLAKIMHQSQELLNNISNLIQGAKLLDIPILWLEQYPQGLGPTNESIYELLTPNEAVSKMTFSACQTEEFQQQLNEVNKKSLLVAGIESHICVYQTVQDLLNHNHEVEVVTDCVSARTLANKQVGIDKMVSIGAKVTSVEMALFELMKTAEHPKFKEISKIIK